jgi:hypothetical protein
MNGGVLSQFPECIMLSFWIPEEGWYSAKTSSINAGSSSHTYEGRYHFSAET